MNFIRFLILLTLFSPSIQSEDPWGEGSQLNQEQKRKIDSSKMSSPIGQLFEQLISFHTNVISPVDGPRSHYRPTSSRYMLLSMRKNGVIRGFIQGCDRLIRENNEKWVYRTVKIDGVEYKHDPIK